MVSDIQQLFLEALTRAVYTPFFAFYRLLTDLVSYRLLNYTPPAVVIRLLTTNGLIAYITSWVLYFSGASSDPRLLLPAWISITTVCRNIGPMTPQHDPPNKTQAQQLTFFLPKTDPYIRLPRHTKPRNNKTRNSGLFTRRLSCQFSQHVLPPPPTPSYP